MSGIDLGRFIRWVMRDVRYHRRYSAIVELDRGNGTYDITPLDESMRGKGLQAVPVRSIAGSEILTVRQGTRCLFGFTNGKPKQPEIVAWEYEKGSAVIAFRGGRARLARAGDYVRGLVGLTTPVSGVVMGLVTPPSGPPIVLPPTPFKGVMTLAFAPRGRIVRSAGKIRA